MRRFLRAAGFLCIWFGGFAGPLNQFVQPFYQDCANGDLNGVADEERNDAHHQGGCQSVGCKIYEPKCSQYVAGCKTCNHSDDDCNEAMAEFFDQETGKPCTGDVSDDITSGCSCQDTQTTGKVSEYGEAYGSQKNVNQLTDSAVF